MFKRVIDLSRSIALVAMLFCLPLSVIAIDASHSEAVEKAMPAFEKSIEQMMKANGIPGMAVAVVSKDKIYYQQTFGVRKLGKPEKISTKTLFQIASLSKPVNATAVAILQEKGKLSFEDPVDRYIPNFKLRNKEARLKVCHLMSHSTGVPNHFNGLIDAYTPRKDVIARIQRTYAVADPGKLYDYNNATYSIVEEVMAKASGKPLDQVLQQELFQPLGMKNASVGLLGILMAEDKAYPHVPNRKGKYVPAEDYSKAYYGFSAAGGVNASLEDLIPFMQLYLGKPSTLISKQGLSRLTIPFVKNNKAVIQHEAKKGVIKDTYYCLGWQSMRYGDKPVIYHSGHLKGFRNFMGYIDDDVGIIVLTNAHRKHASKVALKFFDLYVNANKPIGDVADSFEFAEEAVEAPKKPKKAKKAKETKPKKQTKQAKSTKQAKPTKQASSTKQAKPVKQAKSTKQAKPTKQAKAKKSSQKSHA